MTDPASPSPMDLKPPRKRPLFQIHLSTCVVLMFVAGALVWANVRPESQGAVLGWPQKFCKGRFRHYFGPEGDLYLGHPWLPAAWELWPLLADIGYFALICLVVAVVCEFLVRRRERQP